MIHAPPVILPPGGRFVMIVENVSSAWGEQTIHYLEKTVFKNRMLKKEKIPAKLIFIEVFHFEKHGEKKILNGIRRKTTEDDLQRVLQVFPLEIVRRWVICNKELLFVAVPSDAKLPAIIHTKKRDYVIYYSDYSGSSRHSGIESRVREEEKAGGDWP